MKINNNYRTLEIIFYIVIALRAIISVIFLYPSPVGDSILFLSTSANLCVNGFLGTPIFPIDETGQYRYIWHGFLSPYLYSALNFTCSFRVYYIEHALLSAATAIIIISYYRKTVGTLIPILFACVVYCIQIKQGFRPETLAIFFIVIAEIFRREKNWTAFFVSVFLIAWVQPTVFILNIIFLSVAIGPLTFVRELTKLKIVLMLLVLNGILLMIYPFPVIDLINGLLLQGRTFSARNDGDLFTYFVRSDFLPLFGPTFLIFYCFVLKRKLAFILLLPFIYFYSLRVPPAVYNIFPLYVSILLYLISCKNLLVDTSDVAKRSPLPLMFKPFSFAAFLALIGLLQGLSRDVYSLIVYNSRAETISSDIEILKKSGYSVCNVPPYTTAVFPKLKYAADSVPTLKDCNLKSGADKRVDLIEMIRHPNINFCKRAEWSTNRNTNIPTIFNSDSGYSYLRCFN